jgi:hypothetical protein
MTVLTWPRRKDPIKLAAVALIGLFALFGLFAAGHQLVNGANALAYNRGAMHQAEDVCLDEQQRVEGIVVMQRCGRATIASLRKLQLQGGSIGKHATNALASMEKLMHEPAPTPR